MCFMKDKNDVLKKLDTEQKEKDRVYTLQTVGCGAIAMQVPSDRAKDESAVWKEIATSIKWMLVNHKLQPEDMAVISDEDSNLAEVYCKQEKNGTWSFKPVKNDIYLETSHYEKKMLRKIDEEQNIHLFYDLIPNNMGYMTIDVGARYGTIGEKGLNRIEDGEVLRPPMPSWMYWIQYAKLCAEGYQDMTDSLYDKDDDPVKKLFDDTQKQAEKQTSAAMVLAEHLRNAAVNALQDFQIDFLSNKLPWNRVQLKSCRKLYDSLHTCGSIAEMNEVLKKLIAIIGPTFDRKKGVTVASFLIAKKETQEDQKKEIAKKVELWEGYINAMEAVLGKPKSKNAEENVSPFGNISVEYADQETTDRILKEFRAKPNMDYTVYVINAPDFRARFDAYCRENSITDIRELIHGSRTENWASIIMNGLLLNPNAPITGKAYGYGIYTARDFNKSFGYTNFRGSRWANGTGNAGYIGVYDTAYGKPYFPKGVHDYQKVVEEGGYNCLDAKASYSGFCMDEIVFYREEALCIKYLIEFTEKEK